MHLNKLLIILIGFVLANPIFCFSQQNLSFSYDDLDKEFISNSHLITIEKNVEVEILNQNISKERVTEIVLIKDEEGLSSFVPGTYYDQLSKLDSIRIELFDAEGHFIRNIYQEYFYDIALADGFSLYNDDRLKLAVIHHKKFPFFAKIEFSKTNDYTIFIPSFMPLENEDHKVVATQYVIKVPEYITLNHYEENLHLYTIEKKIEKNKIIYSGKNLIAPILEEMNYRYKESLPKVSFSIDKFSLAKVNGTAKNWNELAVWYHTNFLKDLDSLPITTVQLMKKLTKDAQSELEKVQIIFDYVQKNTRYISIQAGIGGWKPFSAMDVDRFKYGDCKALTNYTKALLQSVGIKSYYTLLTASESIQDINEELIVLQGNHVLLSYPYEEGFVFLECTNQNVPFGFLSAETNHRKVLLVSENGARFETTQSFRNDTNLLEVHITFDLTDVNEVKTHSDIIYKGTFYNDVFEWSNQNKEQLTEYIKSQFAFLKDLKIENTQFTNNKDRCTYRQVTNVLSSTIGYKAGSDLLLPINEWVQLVSIPKNKKNRTTDFQVIEKKTIKLYTKYILPEDFKVEYLPKNETLQSVFGSYMADYIVTQNQIEVSQQYSMFSGNYSKNQFVDYIDFVSKIQKSNQSKIVLTK